MVHRLFSSLFISVLMIASLFWLLSPEVVPAIQADHSDNFTYQRVQVLTVTKTAENNSFSYDTCQTAGAFSFVCALDYYRGLGSQAPGFGVQFDFEFAPPPSGTVGIRIQSATTTSPQQEDSVWMSHYRRIVCPIDFNSCIRGNGSLWSTTHEDYGAHTFLIGTPSIDYAGHGVVYDSFADLFQLGTTARYEIYLINDVDYTELHRITFDWVIDPSLAPDPPPPPPDTSFNPVGISCYAVIDDSGTITNVSNLTDTVEPPSANLLQNYSFENSMDGWQTAVNGSDPMISAPCALDCRFGARNALAPGNFSASTCQDVTLPPLTDTWDVFFGVNHRELVTSTLTIAFGSALSGLSSFSLGQYSAYSSTMTAPGGGTATFCIHSSGTNNRYYDAAWVSIRPSAVASTDPNSNENFICIDPSSTITDTPTITATPTDLPPNPTFAPLPTLPLNLTVTPIEIPVGLTPHPTRCAGWAERRINYDFNLPLSPISVTISNTIPQIEFCFEPQEFTVDTSGSLSFLDGLGFVDVLVTLFTISVAFILLNLVRAR